MRVIKLKLNLNLQNWYNMQKEISKILLKKLEKLEKILNKAEKVSKKKKK